MPRRLLILCEAPSLCHQRIYKKHGDRKYQRANIPRNLGNTAVRRRQCPFIIVVMITAECFVWHHNGACRSAHGKCCKFFILKNHWTVIDPKWVPFPSHHDIPGESRTYHALYGTLYMALTKSNHFHWLYVQACICEINCCLWLLISGKHCASFEKTGFSLF